MLQIYKASAGSGKTYTLAYEYIKLLLGVKNPETGEYELNRRLRDRHRGILAVTFTNKATEEMKQRIVHELAVLGQIEPQWTKPSPYEADLCQELHCTAEQLRPAAAKALRCLLFDFNFFNVSTIDSFFQIVLRTFAREADIAGNYEVDLDNDRAIGTGIRELFDSLSIEGSSEQTRRIIHWITQHLLGELANGKSVSLFDRSATVHSGILKFINQVSNDTFAAHFTEMMDYLSKPELLQQFIESVKNEETSIIQNTRINCKTALDTIENRGYSEGKLKVSAHLLKQLTRCAEDGEETGSSTTANKVLDDVNNAYGVALNKHLTANPDEALNLAITNACDSIVTGGAQLKLYREARASVFVLGLLERVYYHIDKYRAENNTILLSDTNSILREIIGEDDAPFIYERVGLWIHHFLIDEFQDTSRLQWENLRPLLREGQSNDDDSLIIGDEKQCIYRFRDSDPTLLQHQVANEFPGSIKQHPNNNGASTNWRSSATVIKFNNALFKSLAQKNGFDDIYKNVEQRVAPTNDNNRGYVKITAIESSLKEEFHDESLEILTNDICTQLRAGYKASDICVLTRKNPDAALVIDHLMNEASEREELSGVSIISDDAMSVGSAPVVKLILSIMRYMAIPPTDEIDRTDESTNSTRSSRRDRNREIGRLINRYQHIMSTDADPEKALRSAIENTQLEATDATTEIADSMACFNVPSLVERIIAQYVLPEVAAEQNMYLSAFVDVVTDFCSRGTADLQSFLSWWDDKGHNSKVSAPSDENAIRVMTIHKSKGLEFKCVHIPFVDWNVINFLDKEWFITNGKFEKINSNCVPPMLPLQPAQYMTETQFSGQYQQMVKEQRLDELNVTYVAFTRAIDQLCVNYIKPSAKKSDSANKINELLDAALKSIDISLIQSNSDNIESDDNVIILGSPTLPQSEKKKAHTALQPESSEEMNPYATSPRDDLWSTLDIERYLDYGSARDRGIVLHAVLAHVLHDSDLEHAIKKCSYRGHLPKDIASDVLEHLRGQFMRNEIKPWFTDFRKALLERPLVLNSGEVRRPDRVVWTSSGTVDVIDYKFGEEHPEKYAKQVKKYMRALESMGCENVRGFIWYVDSGNIVPVANN